MKTKILTLTIIILATLITIIYITSTVETTAENEYVQVSENTSYLRTQTNTSDRYDIRITNANGENYYNEINIIQTSVYTESEGLIEDIKQYNLSINYSALECTNPNELSLTCRDTFWNSEENNYNIVSLKTGVTYYDAIPSIFGDKQELFTFTGPEGGFVTSYKICTWSENAYEKEVTNGLTC